MEWLKSNWRFSLLAVTTIASLIFGITLTFKAGPPGSKVEIQVVYPEDFQPSFNAQAAAQPLVHPRFHFYLRAKLTEKLMNEKDMNFRDAWRMTRIIPPDDYAGAYAQAAKETNSTAALKFGSLGDGKIIDAILEWLKSPEGKAFMDALLKILMALLMSMAQNGVPLDHPDFVELQGLIQALQSFIA